MIRLVVMTDEMIELAKRRSRELPKLKNSILEGGGNLASFIGQVAFETLTGAVRSNAFDYDCLLKGKKIELKTKQRKCTPTGRYVAEVSAFNDRQKCDYYAFVSTLYSYSLAWVLGCIKPEEFYKRATLRKEGELVDGFIYKCDTWCIEINKLYDVQEIKESE